VFTTTLEIRTENCKKVSFYAETILNRRTIYSLYKLLTSKTVKISLVTKR